MPVEPVDKFEVHGHGHRQRAGRFYAVLDNGSNNLVTLRYRLKDVAVRAVEQSFKSGDQEIPAGSFIVAGSRYDKAEGGGRAAGSDSRRADRRARRSDARRRSAAPGDVLAPGAARRKSAGCATRSINSKSRSI